MYLNYHYYLHLKVTLVVNVASECGFTDAHYKSLIRLKNVLQPTGKFEILAFPCNQFGYQEPGVSLTSVLLHYIVF
jgi:glutathione peroxidase-family protein